LNSKKQGSEEYEKIRQTCKTNCRHTAREFHYWLIENGYLIVKPKK
jgi:phage antirepressor YoqD-like protein